VNWIARSVALLALLAAPAVRADGRSLEVAVGRTIEVNVGYARGWMCDDPSIIKAELVTRGDANIWIVTGVKTGATQCRVGTDMDTPVYYLFDLRVVAKKK
jgi:hypothetical protein